LASDLVFLMCLRATRARTLVPASLMVLHGPIRQGVEPCHRCSLVLMRNVVSDLLPRLSGRFRWSSGTPRAVLPRRATRGTSHCLMGIPTAEPFRARTLPRRASSAIRLLGARYSEPRVEWLRPRQRYASTVSPELAKKSSPDSFMPRRLVDVVRSSRST